MIKDESLKTINVTIANSKTRDNHRVNNNRRLQ